MQVHQSHQFQDQDRTDLLSIRSAQRRIDLLHEVGSIHSGIEYIFIGIVHHFDTSRNTQALITLRTKTRHFLENKFTICINMKILKLGGSINQ